MISTKTWRLVCLFLPLCALVACDSGNEDLVSVSADSKIQGELAEAPTFEGERLVVFHSGRSQTAVYLADQKNGEAIEVDVPRLPEGASYSVTEDDGDAQKRIAITWSPSSTSAGYHEAVLHGRTLVSGQESFWFIDLWVAKD